MKPSGRDARPRTRRRARAARARRRGARRTTRRASDEDRRDREPVDVRRVQDHLNCSCTCRGRARSPAKEWCDDPGRPGREDEQHADERHDERELARPQVERLVGHGRAARLVQHGGDQPQHVHRGEHDRAGADRGPPPGALEGAREDQELARERRRAGHGERDHADRHQERRERRPSLRHPAEQRELVRSSSAARPRPRSGRATIETRPCATICSTAPSKPRFVPEKRPSAISPDCASDEYATTPRKSGERNASSEP